MAMRPRGGRGGHPNHESRFIVGRVYEPFKPMSEWRQENDYDTLLVYLPGFHKEYIKVTTEDLNIVRVRGERLVAENKWSRFQEDFRVPENCEMRGIRARFDGGILTITMPRKIITAPPPPPPPPTTTRVSPKSEKPPPHTTRVAPRSDLPPPPPPTTRDAPKSEKPPPPPPTTRDAPKSEKPPPPPPTTRVTPKSEKPPPPPPPTTRDAPKSEKPPSPPTPTTTRVAPKSEEPPFTRIKQEETLAQKPKHDSKERATYSNNAPAALESEKKPQRPPLLDEGGSTSTLPPQSQPQPMPTKQEQPSKTAEAGGEFTFGSTIIPKKDKEDGSILKPNDKGKSKESVVEEENKNAGGSHGGKVVENAVVKGGDGWRVGLNEDRKTMVNMGVSVLVIVALGIHVSYTIGLIGKGK